MCIDLFLRLLCYFIDLFFYTQSSFSLILYIKNNVCLQPSNMVVYINNPSSQETEIGGLWGHGQYGLHSKFEASLGYIHSEILPQKKKKTLHVWAWCLLSSHIIPAVLMLNTSLKLGKCLTGSQEDRLEGFWAKRFHLHCRGTSCLKLVYSFVVEE
jgi:hypothetical protein